LFDKYGDVGDIYIPTERGTGRSRGFAFVRYYDKRDAEVSLPHNNLKSSFSFFAFLL
jgi:RNA recognition motif-containing protein